MLTPSSLFRKGVVALALIVFVICATRLNAKKPIIYIPRSIAFAPFAKVNPAGNLMHFEMSQRSALCRKGDTILIKATVYQPATGARGIGVSRELAGSNKPPVMIVHLVRGSRPFQPGPVVASAVGTRSDHMGILQGTWKWKSNVTLFR